MKKTKEKLQLELTFEKLVKENNAEAFKVTNSNGINLGIIEHFIAINKYCFCPVSYCYLDKKVLRIIAEFMEKMDAKECWKISDERIKRFKELYGKESGAMSHNANEDLIIWDDKNEVWRHANEFQEVKYNG